MGDARPDERRLSPAVAEWARRGTYQTFDGLRVFCVDLPSRRAGAPALLVLHGFPTSSYDFHHTVEALTDRYRVLLLDFPGYGLSAKPDRPYTLDLLADAAAGVVGVAGVTRLGILSHDLGDTVGGELLARQLEGRWPVEVTGRVLTNGSIYIEMAQLSAGQQFLLSLPDAALGAEAPIDRATLAAGLSATFGPDSAVPGDEVDRLCELVELDGGTRILPRLIRYIEERRARQSRFTGAIETHPSAVSVVWGAEDPIAVVGMVDRFVAARPEATVRRLEGVGHYPMLETPDRFASAVAEALDEVTG